MVARFRPRTEPTATEVRAAVEAVLRLTADPARSTARG